MPSADDNFDGEKDDDSEEEDEQDPCYPFPADFALKYQSTRIMAIRHLCKAHPSGTGAVAIFLPGVHGGVGPCREPGSTFDEMALFASVCSRLVEVEGVNVDCYRCSWPCMRPRMSQAVEGVCRVVHYGIQQALGEFPCERELKVILVGHSLGGAVAVHAASMMAAFFEANGLGLDQVTVRVEGLCTLNGAIDCSDSRMKDALSPLSSVKALLICGEADAVVPPRATDGLFEALESKAKHKLSLPGGTHDLFAHKALLIEELVEFIRDCA